MHGLSTSFGVFRGTTNDAPVLYVLQWPDPPCYRDRECSVGVEEARGRWLVMNSRPTGPATSGANGRVIKYANDSSCA